MTDPTSSSFEGWPAVLTTLSDRVDIGADRAGAAFRQILAGDATESQISAFMVALRMKGESADEIVGLVTALLHEAAPLNLPTDTVDIVGTGGSATLRGGAFNVSTIASIVAAAAGATVAKHGNRKASSTSGSTDLLECLGVNVELDGAGVERCVAEAGVGFCFARMFHPAMRHVGPARAELGIPTVFNILGPLSHPGHVRRQVLGVADPARVDVIAEVLARRQMTHALVVHGSDGLDEITTTGPTDIVEIRDGEIVERVTINASDLGIPRRSVDEITVGDPGENAVIARRILEGGDGAHRDLVVINTAAGLVVAGVAVDFADGIDRANAVLDSGAAAGTLERLIDASNTPPPDN